MYTDAQLERVDALVREIEARKTHEYAAPTYKDSPVLKELACIALSCEESSPEVLEEKIPMLWYLADCYDRMCRWGVSVTYHKLLLEHCVEQMEQGGYTAENVDRFEDAFYAAVKARNQYQPDECPDLVRLAEKGMSTARARKLRDGAMDSRRGLPKSDPVELTPAYLAVIDEVEEWVDQNSRVHICHEYWSLKADALAKRGIHWRSPALLNPHVLFD